MAVLALLVAIVAIWMVIMVNDAFNRAWSVVKMPARDVRYKITPEDVERMREMKASGMSMAAISRQLIEEGIPASPGIVNYWTNEASRMAQRAKNAKRRYEPGSEENTMRIARDQAKRKANWDADPEMKLRHNIQSAMDEKRPTHQRHTVQGVDLDEARKWIESGELTRPNAKIPERERHEDYE